VAYNLTDKPVTATMTGWNVAPGQWSLTQGLDANGDDAIDGAGESRSVAFERSQVVTLTLAPRQTTVIDMKLTTAGDDPAKRADLGVGRGDVTVKGFAVTAKVHSLGAQDAVAAKLELVDAAARCWAARRPGPEGADGLAAQDRLGEAEDSGRREGVGLRVRIVTSQPQNTALNDESASMTAPRSHEDLRPDPRRAGPGGGAPAFAQSAPPPPAAPYASPLSPWPRPRPSRRGRRGRGAQERLDHGHRRAGAQRRSRSSPRRWTARSTARTRWR
jgi:hypothetical protein